MNYAIAILVLGFASLWALWRATAPKPAPKKLTITRVGAARIYRKTYIRRYH